MFALYYKTRYFLSRIKKLYDELQVEPTSNLHNHVNIMFKILIIQVLRILKIL